ncbi:hypothetical protein COV06_01735 [Candidatus Uhrbacteria bacterium CG10_big_fil_rev_8_21_14_0_10_50_16]|uniref:Uncharacterized protein n=1 Tax=Candidatus Uhrbacteria bacterium CG10_big_fil_rev_8_21_14_0_10_50_16 TaxID=1975039 RepID=A0A2H0RMH0_9BACT|nr:MAG: hypothetical protein COV06_01735 [Candidatus Uhrbacteria bacterium CG10_big_fil_rev_8_21_14_0_10_50_16]
MAQSPLSRLTAQEYAARQRLLRLILGLMGVLVVVLIIVQLVAVVPKSAQAIDDAVEQGKGAVGDISLQTDAIKAQGSAIAAAGAAARDSWFMMLIQESVLRKVATKIEQLPDVPIVEAEIITEETVPVITETDPVPTEETATHATQ